MKVASHVTLIIIATVLALFSYLSWSFSPPASLTGRDLLVVASAISAIALAGIAVRNLGFASTSLVSLATFLLVLSVGAISNGQPKALDETGITIVAMLIAGILLAGLAVKELNGVSKFLVVAKA